MGFTRMYGKGIYFYSSFASSAVLNFKSEQRLVNKKMICIKNCHNQEIVFTIRYVSFKPKVVRFINYLSF